MVAVEVEVIVVQVEIMQKWRKVKKKKYEFSNHLLEEFRVGRVVVLGLVLSGGGGRRWLQR